MSKINSLNRSFLLTTLIVAVVLGLISGNSYALSCYSDYDLEHSTPPLDPKAAEVQEANKIKDAKTCFLLGTCGVCVPSPNAKGSDGSTWLRPMVRIVYSHLLVNGVQRADLAVNECTWLGGVRFCARRTMPERDGDIQQNGYGNLDNKTRLCVFQDPMDGMDSDVDEDGVLNRYHNNEVNLNGTHIMGTMALASGMVGGVGAGVGAALLSNPVGWIAAAGLAAGMAIGAGIGAIVDAITSHHNHIVGDHIGDNGNRGCVNFPIAEGPPVFRNSAWNTSFVPMPLINYHSTSTFLTPALQLTICKKSANDDTVVMCQLDLNDENHDGNKADVLERNTPTKESFSLSPQNNYDEKKHFRDRHTAVDERIFEARVSSRRPHEVCVYQLADAKDEKGNLLGCLPRPGYMPAPITKQSGNFETPTVKISFPGNTTVIEIAKDTCGILSQVTFCAYQPCMDTERHDTCQNPGDMLCTSGFNSAPKVVAATLNDIAVPSTQTPPGNMLKVKDVAFDNFNANGEFIDSVKTPKKVQFSRNVLVYDPPKCNQRDDNTGNCLNYDGLPNGKECCTAELCPTVSAPYRNSDNECIQYVRNVTGDDPYKINPATQMIRPLSGVEMGYCAAPPPDMKPKEFTTPGTYTYKIPAHCGAIEVEMWGAGGAGTSYTSQNNLSGGGGGYIKAKINNTVPNASHTVIVGHGGIVTGGFDNRLGHAGANSSFSGNAVVAGGGKANNSGSPGGTNSASGATIIENKPGIQGNHSPRCEDPGSGGSTWNPLTQQYYNSGSDSCAEGHSFDESITHRPPAGSGGCGSYRCYVASAFGYRGSGNPGVGSHGKVSVRCVEAINDVAY